METVSHIYPQAKVLAPKLIVALMTKEAPTLGSENPPALAGQRVLILDLAQLQNGVCVDDTIHLLVAVAAVLELESLLSGSELHNAESNLALVATMRANTTTCQTGSITSFQHATV